MTYTIHTYMSEKLYYTEDTFKVKKKKKKRKKIIC